MALDGLEGVLGEEGAPALGRALEAGGARAGGVVALGLEEAAEEGLDDEAAADLEALARERDVRVEPDEGARGGEHEEHELLAAAVDVVDDADRAVERRRGVDDDLHRVRGARVGPEHVDDLQRAVQRKELRAALREEAQLRGLERVRHRAARERPRRRRHQRVVAHGPAGRGHEPLRHSRAQHARLELADRRCLGHSHLNLLCTAWCQYTDGHSIFRIFW